MATEEIESLVTRARRGDVEAYCHVVRRFQDMAYGYAYSILGDCHLAEDAAQEAFVEAYRDLSRLRRPGAFAGWLRRIIFKHCDRIARRKRIPAVALDAAGAAQTRDAGPSEAAASRELAEKVRFAIRSLPEKQRTVTTLFYINGYSQAEIAAFLVVPVTTVNSRLHGARRRLKERMLEMVASELQAAKPEAEFVRRVREVLTLRKRGKLEDARGKYKAAFEDLAGLQNDGRFAEVLRTHEAMVKAIRDDGTYADMCVDSYRELSTSYEAVGKPADAAEGILRELPARTPAKKNAAMAGNLKAAAHLLLKADLPDRAAEQARRMLRVLERVKGQSSCRFLRNEALLILYRAALKRQDQAGAPKVLQRIRAELSAYEEELSAAANHREEWRRQVGDAYHNTAHNLACFGDDTPEAIPLMRRAAELRQFGPSHMMLAGWILSAGGDREAALAHFKQAAKDTRFTQLLRNEFRSSPHFQPVRRDRRFLAVINP